MNRQDRERASAVDRARRLHTKHPKTNALGRRALRRALAADLRDLVAAEAEDA